MSTEPHPVVPAPPTAVTGGSAGLAAQYAELRALASAYDGAGDRLREQARLGVRVLGDGDLLESALLSPVTFAEAEAEVARATSGPDGLVPASVAWEADAVLVRVTVTAFEETDELVRQTFEAVDYLAGRALGHALALGLVAGVATAPVWVPAVDEGDSEVLAAELEAWVVDHPELVQHLANGGGGLVNGFWGALTPAPLTPWGVGPFTPATEDAAGVLAGLFPADGDPVVVARDDLATPSAPQAPGSLADVMTHLDEVNQWSTSEHPGDNGTIDIQTWVGDDGMRHHIVYLPGTDDMTTLPWTMDDDVRDMPTNLLAVNGQSTAYAQGILQAMHEAGIASDEPVLLAGHSQGGIEAAWIATHTSDFHVTQVVTAGSPVALMGDYPPGTQVLSLEHHGDVMPLLAGEDNPDALNHVTVTFDDHEPSLAGNHAIWHYANGAAGVDASDQPSLVSALTAMRDDGFLTGTAGEAHTQAFQISRAR